MKDSNIDKAEIAKFNDVAAHWWDKDGELKSLHDINPLRLNYINKKAPLADKIVLDMGCGGGILSESMATLGATVTGIDMSDSLIKIAKLHALESKVDVDYRTITAEQLANEQPEQFDIITCMEMLEHVPDPASIIDACARLLKPGGQLFLSTLNRNMKSYLFAIVGAEYVLKLIPKNTHDYAKFIRPSELTEWARKAGLHVRDMIGLTYNPLTKHYKLTTDVSVNYLMQITK